MTSVMPRKPKKKIVIDMDVLKDRLAKARIKLVLDHPFYGVISMQLPVVWTDKVPTAAVDGRHMYFNPEFVHGLTDLQLVFLIAHECMHLMLNHCTRRCGRDPKRWNIAGDYIGNEFLINDKIGEFIPGGLYDPSITENLTLSTEQVYDKIPEQGEGGGGEGGEGDQPLDEVMDCDDPALEQEIKVMVSQAAQAAEMAGKLSAGQKRLVGELVHPKVPWRDVLRDFPVRCRTVDRTFARPNRRHGNNVFILPSVDGQVMGEMAVFVDCSGSIDDKILNDFAAEIRAIHEQMRPEKLHVVYFDTDVLHHDEFDTDDEVSITPHGGGGTMFSPMFKYMAEQDATLTCAVVLTDLQCGDFGPAPDYPVLWVTTDATAAPWGQVVKVS